jgi:hypothetical protein
MKKLLCGFFCVTAGALLAAEVTVATVDVIAVDSGMKNTVVAIPGLDLATGDNLAISNLVKTTNLSDGDMLYAFKNGSYETWTLDSGVWTRNTALYSVNNAGQIAATEGTASSDMTMSVGSGIWLSRVNSTYAKGNPFYIYAAHVASPSTTVAAGATVLLGNPLTAVDGDKFPTVTGAQSGDVIIIPTAKLPRSYTYNGSAWVGIGALPAIARGTGFWYKATASGSTRTVTW